MKKILSLSLALMLMCIMPVCMAEENVKESILINSSDFNYDAVFTLNEGLARTDELANSSGYSKEAFTSPLSLGDLDYTFAFGDGAKVKNNDSVHITSEYTVSLGNLPYKKIGFIGFAKESACNVKLKIVYKSTAEEEHTVNLQTSYTETTISATAGKELIDNGRAFGRKIIEGSNERFINAYEVTPGVASAIDRIVIQSTDCVLFAVSVLKYTQAELDEISQGAINSYWETYMDKTLTEITSADLDNLNLLYNALLTAKDTGDALGTDENIEKIANLKDGYVLYTQKKYFSEYFTEKYAVKNYPQLTISDINDDDILIIDEIIDKYNEAQSFDEDKYESILSYFNMVDTFNTYNTEDKDTLINLKESYLRKKYEDNLTARIEAIFSQYENVTSITDADVAALDELIALYEEASENNVAYNEEDYLKIKKLRNNYVNFKNSENDICYDLTPYYTGSIVANVGDTSQKFGFKDSDGYVGWSIATFQSYISGGYISAKNNFNYTYEADSDTNPKLTKETLSKEVKFKAPEDLTATGKNAVLLCKTENKDNGNLKTITINSPKRISKRIAFLFGVGRSDVYMTVTLNYTDGETFTQTWRTRWAGHETSTTLDQGGKMLRANNSSAISQMAVSASNNKVMARGLILDIPEDKSVASVTITSTSDSGSALLGISEIPVSNADFTSKLTAQWDIVKNYESQTVTKSELDDINKMILYADECEKRGIELETYGIDSSKIDSFREMNLEASHSVYRENENTVKAEFDFTVPVTQTDIRNKITVTKNSKAYEDYEAEFSNNGKKLTVTLNETKNGGNEYSITLSGGISIAQFPSIKLDNDYVVSYTVPDYLEYSYNETEFTIKNNSNTEAKGYVGLSVIDSDGKSLYYADIKPYTVSAQRSVTVSCDSAAYTGMTKKAVLWDENMKVVSNSNDISSATSDVVETADYKEPIFDMADNSVILNGFTPSKEKDKVVSIKVVDDRDSVIYVGSKITNEKGYFDFSFLLPAGVYTQTRTFTFFVGGDDFATPEKLTNTIYYFAPTERRTYVANLKGMTDNELTNEILTMKKKMAIDFAPANAISDSDYATMILNNKNMLVETDIALTQQNLKKLAIVSAFSGNNADLLMNGNEFKYDDLFGYSNIDTSGVELYSILKTGISDTGMTAFKEAVFNKNYANETDVIDAIKEAIFLSAINYPNSGGIGYIEKLLTSQNAAAVNININNYLNNANYLFNSAIAQNAGSFDTLSAVEAFIANYTVTAPTPPSGGISSSPSGGVSGGFKSDMSGATDTPQEPEYTFNDVTSSHWAYKNIMSLYNKGIISGKDYKTFAPDDYITRGELVKIICTAYNLKAVNTGIFTDTSGKWYEAYAQAGYDNGIISGIAPNEFGGDMPITRQDICTILYRISKEQITATLEFEDADAISDYAENAVAFMVEKGIVNGFKDNTFAPNNSCTRAQAAKIIDMFLQLK